MNKLNFVAKAVDDKLQLCKSPSESDLLVCRDGEELEASSSSWSPWRVLTNLSLGDRGEYSCAGGNSLGTGPSHSLQLAVTGAGVPVPALPSSSCLPPGAATVDDTEGGAGKHLRVPGGW